MCDSTGWHKKRGLLKNPTKIEEIQEKNLLTEIFFLGFLQFLLGFSQVPVFLCHSV